MYKYIENKGNFVVYEKWYCVNVSFEGDVWMEVMFEENFYDFLKSINVLWVNLEI